MQRTKRLFCENFDIANILYGINSIFQDVDFSKARIAISANEKTFVLFDEGRRLSLKGESIDFLNEENELILTIDLGVGNYTATAFGRLE